MNEEEKRMSERRLSKLASFIKLLETNTRYKFNINNFNSRLKLQKYVYLSNSFGFDFDYPHSMYIRGPYAPPLADDYYKLHENKEYLKLAGNVELGASKSSDLVGNRGQFIKLVRGKSEEWLEIASTFLMIWERYKDKEFAIKATKETKPWTNREDIKEIAKRFEELGVIS